MEPIFKIIENEIVDTSPGVKFSDVKGLEDVKQALFETIILPTSCPDIFTGIRAPPRGLLLYGSPGNGKTMIAKAVATACKSTFFNISTSALVSKYVGESEKLMKALFTLARERAPSVIFIDEIDAILKSRRNSEAEHSRRLKTEFLVQFDSFTASADEARVVVIGATNLPWEIDMAVLRRFPIRYEVPIPNSRIRQQLLKSIEKKVKTRLSNDDFSRLVKHTKGYSCSDIIELCKDAVMGPIRDIIGPVRDMVDINLDTCRKITETDLPPVNFNHFQAALRNVRPSLSPISFKRYKKWGSIYGSKVSVSY